MLRQQGIAAAKAGQKDEARQLLQQSIRLEPASEAAWLWLASVARDSREREFCLKKILEINPNNTQALQGLATLESHRPARAPAPGIKPLSASARPTTREAETESASTAPASPFIIEPEVATPVVAPKAAVESRIPTEAEIMNQPPGIPMPSAEGIAEAQRAAEQMIRQAEAPVVDEIKWVRKSKNRAGEGEVNVLRAQIAAAAAATLAATLIFGGVFVATNADAQLVVFGPSRTPSPSPTVTPTNTPGSTPTPSAPPRREPTATPEPPSNLNPADPFNLPLATDVYPPLLEIPEQLVAAINGPQAEAVIPTLAAIRRGQGEGQFSPNAYYYEALAKARSGDFTDALAVLADADDAMTSRTTPNEIALIRSGYAQIYWSLAEDARSSGNSARFSDYRTRALENALLAIGCALPVNEDETPTPQPTAEEDAVQLQPSCDERLAEPYRIAAQVLASQNRISDALDVLDTGLDVDALSGNVDLILEKGRLLFDQGEFDQAGYQAYLALYVDPATEAAYQLSIASLLAQNKPGDAVQQAQTYLHYFPGSSTAFSLLGEARVAEGNPDLAAVAFAQAAQGGTDHERARALQGLARILINQGEFQRARELLNDALRLSNDASIRADRLVAALNDTGFARRFEIALEDIDTLRGSEAVSEVTLNLLEGRALIDGAFEDLSAPECPDSTSAFSQALTLLNPVSIGTNVSADERALANEYVARAQYCLGDLETALNQIDLALASGDSADRRYWRGRIAEALGDEWQAARDYEWVLSLAAFEPINVPSDLQSRLEDLPQATRTPDPTETPAAGS